VGKKRKKKKKKKGKRKKERGQTKYFFFKNVFVNSVTLHVELHYLVFTNSRQIYFAFLGIIWFAKMSISLGKKIVITGYKRE
jgi:hypothetical protein